MKLNNVIILNIYQLRQFFVFKEFWLKRHEFTGTVDKYKNMFFSTLESMSLYEHLVKEWLEDSLSEHTLNRVKLEEKNLVFNGHKIKRICTLNCEKELSHFKPSDRIGIVALYEMIGSKLLKTDIIEVMALLGIDYYDFFSDFIGIRDGKELELQSFQSAESGDNLNCPLRNVLIANVSDEGEGGAVVCLGQQRLVLNVGECCRAVFWGRHCLNLIYPDNGEIMRFYSPTKTTSAIIINGLKEDIGLSVIDIVSGRGKGFLLLTNNSNRRIIARHERFDDVEMNDSFPSNELPVHIVLDPSEKEVLLLTDLKNLYRFATNKWELVSSDVLKADYDDNGKINILHRRDLLSE